SCNHVRHPDARAGSSMGCPRSRRVRALGARRLKLVEGPEAVISHVSQLLERAAEFLEFGHEIVHRRLYLIPRPPAALGKEEVSHNSAQERANRRARTQSSLVRHGFLLRRPQYSCSKHCATTRVAGSSRVSGIKASLRPEKPATPGTPARRARVATHPCPRRALWPHRPRTARWGCPAPCREAR